ncbi:ParB N-terminal domain-containing protein [Pelagibacterium flavum]|uniref:ParB N-terminal domain-containing protein n=1 Tax=Pelagibacterium flavum TaxID=2984530 RepID=A0ABY6IUR1_9HYPH|nr:plasmid partitioning protein RepB C-terminal domain-containing protein [Pelagibacterium sp. YIM 151497]UYQ73042.1 ParB N-terminal domain-containing protein [Pelagibacterium sp. YIM 151497]
MDVTPNVVTILPIANIRVINPRTRNKKSFRELVESIEKIGLKRPITVAINHHAGDEPAFNLVCGQGRVEAYKTLGQSEIPAIIIEASEEEVLIKSLVENCARRQHNALDLLRDIGGMKERHYTDAEIAKKTNLSVEYVRGIARLLAQNEQRLLRAVEAEQLPLSVAVDIATVPDEDVQDALQKAYERKELRGRKLLIAKRLVENRRRRGKGLRVHLAQKATSAASLLRAYQQDTDRKRILIRKAEAAKNRLLFVTHALRELLSDERFHDILEAEGLSTLPKNLSNRIRKGEIA